MKRNLFLISATFGLLLLFPSFSNAQKSKKNSSTKPTTKTTTKPTTPAKAETKWETIKIEECGFSAELPNGFEKKNQVVNGRISTYWIYNSSSNVNNNTLQYMASCSPLSDAAIENPEYFLAGQLSALDGRVLSKSKISLSGNIGIETLQIAPTGWLEHMKSYVLVGKGVSVSIQMNVKDEKTVNETKADRTKFFNSLKFL
jgi:hypothetical protein